MPKPKALNRISDINIAELTLCKNPAVPAAGHFVLKTEDAAAGKQVFNYSFTIKSTDAKKKQIFLYFLAPDEPDLQGDVASAEEVEKACHTYMKNLGGGAVKGDGTGQEHNIFKNIGYPIQCAIDYTGAIGKAAGCDISVVGGWWVGIQCTDETWDKVEKGEIKGGSIGGIAVRTPIEGAGTDGAAVGKTFRGIIDSMFATLRKQESGPVTFDEAVAENETRQKLWDIIDAMHTSLYSILDDDSLEKDAKIVKMGASIDQFKVAMLSFLAVQKAIRDIAGASAAVIANSEAALKAAQASITNELNKLTDKAGQPDNGGNDMELKEVTKAIEDALAPVLTQVTALKTDIETLKAAKPAGDPPPVEKKADDKTPTVEKVLFDAVEKIKTLTDRMEKIEKTPTARQGETEEGKPEVKKSELGGALLGTGGEKK